MGKLTDLDAEDKARVGELIKALGRERQEKEKLAQKLDAFADRLRETVGRVLEVSGRAAYNLVWRLPPAKARRDPAAFWHVAICPRGGPGAGLELTTGMSLVSVAPEDAAKALR